MLIDKLNFDVPQSLIAIHPKKPRDMSKVVIVNEDFKIENFKNLINYLQPNDALVFNDSRVLPAGLYGILENKIISVNLNKLIERKKKVIWSAFIKSKKKIIKDNKIFFSNYFFATVSKIRTESDSKLYFLTFNYSYKIFKEKLDEFGKAPIPPYILKKRTPLKSDLKDYQSLLAKNDGSVAAPTASLHFTKRLLSRLEKKGIKIINVTLHVSAGTFLPIRQKNINKHKMHFEYGYISKKSSSQINRVKKNGGKIIAVGTTVLRILESSKDSNGFVLPFKGETNIFIKPGWKISTVNGLITNFHTPNSTLLTIVFSLLGEKKTKLLYEYAIRKKLRFFSYGDACLLWKKNDWG